MHQPHVTLLRAAIGAGALAFAFAVQAQTEAAPVKPPAPLAASEGQNTPAPLVRQQQAEIARGDPARWHQEDVTTAQRMRTLRKEIAAGLQENLGACRSQPAAERSACQREAHAIYQREMADLGRAR